MTETPTVIFQAELIERLLDAPGLRLDHDQDVAHRVVAAACADLVEHSQQVRLRGDDCDTMVELAEGVLKYNTKSKRLFDGLYRPPPALSDDWVRHLRTWLAEIRQDQAETKRRGRPTNTWEPYLFASGLGLYSALYGQEPTTTGHVGLKAGPTMRFMIELIAAGRTICEKYGRNAAPWRPRERPALKKQIKSLLDFEKSRLPWLHHPKVPDSLYRPNSYGVYREIYLVRLRGQSPFSIRCWDDLA